MHCNATTQNFESGSLSYKPLEHEFYHTYQDSDNAGSDENVTDENGKKNCPGYVFVCYRNPNGDFEQKAVLLSKLSTTCDALADANIDCWISQGVFSYPCRRKSALKSIALSFIDLDCYKYEWAAGMTPEQMAASFNRFCDAVSVPRPSLIVFSGRGLQCKWLYDKAIPCKALPRWDAVQKELCRKFAQYGADQNAKDCSRILRVEGTMNTKSRRYVYVVYRQHDEQKQVRRFGFDAFADSILPFTREELRQKRQARSICQKKSEQQNASSTLTIQTLHKARAADLVKLAELRGGIKEGHREVFLFDLMCSLTLSGECTDATFFAKAQAMAAQCCPDFSLNKSDLTTLFKRTKAHLKGERVTYQGREKTPIYTFKTETLIRRHAITVDEQRQLQVLIDPGVKRERSLKARAEKRRADGALTRQEYTARSSARRDRAKALYADGVSKAEIARQMGLSRSTVTRYLQGEMQAEKSVESMASYLVVKPAGTAPEPKAHVALLSVVNARSGKAEGRAGRSPELRGGAGESLLLVVCTSSGLRFRPSRIRKIRPKRQLE